mgnify:FL=1
MACDYLELIENESGGYDYYCKLTGDITDPNSCFECDYFPKKDNQQLDVKNKGPDYD